MADLGTAYVAIEPTAKGISGKISELFGADDVGKQAGESIGSQIASFATKAIAGLGLGKMISDSVTNGMDFESGMAKVSTLFSGTNEELAELQSQILEISSATGLAAADLTEAAYSAESASVPMGNLGGMIENSAKLATAGFTDIDTALSATAKTMNAYGMMTDDVAETQANMEKVQRILIQTQNKGITTVGELGTSLAQVTGTAASAGVNFEQVGAAMALMTARGTPTAQATTQLRSAIAELEKQGTQASKALTEAAKGTEYAGQSFTEMMANGANLGDVMGMLQDYADKTGVSMLDLWSSVEGGNAAMAIASDINAFNDDLAAMASESDVVGEAFGTMSDTATFKLDALKESLKNMGIEAFAASADLFKGALDGISEIMTAVLPSFQELGSALGDLFTKIGDVVTETFDLDENFSLVDATINAITGVVDGLSGVISFLTDNLDTLLPIISAVAAAIAAWEIIGFITGLVEAWTAAQAALNVVLNLNPIGLIVIAVAALVAAFIALWKNSEGFREFWIGLWENIKGAFQAAVDAIKTGIENVKTFFSNMKEAVSNVWEAILNNPVIQAIIDYVQNSFENLKNTLTGMWNGLKDFFGGIWDLIKNIFLGAVLIIIDLVTGNFDKLKEDLSHIWDNIKEAVERIWTGIKEYFGSIVEGIVTQVKLKFDALKQALSGIWDSVKDKAVSAWNDFKEKIIETARNLVDSVREKVTELPGIIKEKFNEAVDFVRELPSKALEWGRDLIGNFIDGIKQKWEDLKGGLSSTAETIRGYLHFSEPDVGPLKDFHTYAPDMMKLFIQGIKDNTGLLQRQIEDSFDFSMPYQDALISTRSAATYQPVNSDRGLLEQVVALLNQYLPNTEKSIVLDTGTLVGATAGAYDAAIGIRGIRSSRR